MRLLLAVGIVGMLAAPGAARQEGQLPKGKQTNPDAALIADFRTRAEEYVAVRNSAARQTPPLKNTPHPEDIAQAEHALAEGVRAARPKAARGDLFTPATEALFRRLLKVPLVKQPNAVENKAIMKEDAPAAAEVPFKVNAEYPKDTPLSTVPPDVLLALPPLPDDLQYRFAGRHLILLDAKANLIVDYMLNALP